MPTVDLEKLGDRLRSLRTANGLTQVELANRLGVSKQQVNHWENGRSALTLEHFVNLSQLYDLDPGQVLSGSVVANAALSPGALGRAVPFYNESEICSLFEGMRKRTAEKRVFSKAECSAEALAFSIFDRGMLPTFAPDDLVIVDPAVSPQPGDCVAVLLRRDSRVLFRHFRPAAEGQAISPPYTLRAENPDFEPRAVTKQDRPEFLGTLIEHTRFGSLG